jgi:hypothetical protein
MRKGDKVLCISPAIGWRKTSKPAPKKGWVYLVKSISAFDDEGRGVHTGTRFGIALEGVEPRVGDMVQFFAPSAFRLIKDKPARFPKGKK